jgi:NAD(P)-dependent dehydrogenase (short-subunit alcohol dehydrogenase family)
MCRPYYEVPEIKEDNESTTPLGRWMATEEVAPLAVFLASDDAGYMTGSLIPIDGGYTAR